MANGPSQSRFCRLRKIHRMNIKKFLKKITSSPHERLKTMPRFVPGKVDTPIGAISYVDALSTYHQYQQIFKRDCYQFSRDNQHADKVSHIIDCGANIGLSSVYLARQY